MTVLVCSMFNEMSLYCRASEKSVFDKLRLGIILFDDLDIFESDLRPYQLEKEEKICSTLLQPHYNTFLYSAHLLITSYRHGSHCLYFLCI